MLPMLPQDKANHLIYGLGIGLLALTVSMQFLPEKAPLFAIGLSALAGAFKEALDWYQNRQALKTGQEPPHEVALADFVATAFGGVLVAATAVVGRI